MSGPSFRLRRSMLYTPGDRGDRIEKAIRNRAADMVVADLEDAVAPEAKHSARVSVREAFAATDDVRATLRPERCVRINTWRGALAVDDLDAVVPARPDIVVLPKAERVADLVALDVTLERLERRHGIVPGTIRIIAIVETARGVLEAERLARASSRLVALAFGAEDLAADAGLKRTRSNMEVHAPRSRVALACAAAGIEAIDQVFVDIDDVQGVGVEAREARCLGYAGKMLIHPKQVAPVHDAFSPSVDEVAAARRLVAAAESAQSADQGVLRFEGRMIDVPLIEQARRVVAQADAAAKDP